MSSTASSEDPGYSSPKRFSSSSSSSSWASSSSSSSPSSSSSSSHTSSSGSFMAHSSTFSPNMLATCQPAFHSTPSALSRRSLPTTLLFSFSAFRAASKRSKASSAFLSSFSLGIRMTAQCSAAAFAASRNELITSPPSFCPLGTSAHLRLSWLHASRASFAFFLCQSASLASSATKSDLCFIASRRRNDARQASCRPKRASAWATSNGIIFCDPSTSMSSSLPIARRAAEVRTNKKKRLAWP
mmetsp:Transcript_42651/g.110246  ORF Transcript_42651/g.110246 Transcript_42651/m.110246 type:complete len:243 (+) Transcript_42651:1685-2413(+)